MDYNNLLLEKVNSINTSLKEVLPPVDKYPNSIHKSMHYSVFAGGKRLRPLLTLASGELFGTSNDFVLPAACAIEMIHTYSLIHDDLPSLDDDDLRRGKPTNHIVFGEDMAILAGDALLTQGFYILARKYCDFPAIANIIKEVSFAVGTEGMIGGQVADLESENKRISIQELEFIHNHKTGRLITAAVLTGALLGNAKSNDLNNLTEYAKNIGLAFQIIDDLLDIKGDEALLGKRIGSDTNLNKATYPSLLGEEESMLLANELYENALASVSCYGNEADFLSYLAQRLVKRVK